MTTPGIIHTITPGDHFSPRTGSAIPTVVDGLATAAASAGAGRHSVVVDGSTFRPWYESADVIEYSGNSSPSKWARYADVMRGRIGVPRSATASYYRPIANAVLGQPPSTVLAHNAPILPWLLRHSGHRVVLFAHNDVLRTYTRTEARRVLANAAAIICVSESLARRTRERLPAGLAGRVRVVGNAVDVHRFSPAHGVAKTWSGPIRVMFVGRMIREKGVDVLLRAVTAFTRDEVELVIVGSQGFNANASLSTYEQKLRALADSVSVRVSFRPFVDRLALPGLLRSADVLVVPSRWAEPSGLTIGEGMATGLPIIASRVGGIPEVLGPAGILVDPDDPRSLAAAIRRLARDPSLRASMGVTARSRAEAHDWAWAWRNLREVLDSCAS